MTSSSTPESPFRPNILAGKVALVTGGTSGIGLEIAMQLGLHGAAVVVTGRRQAVLDSACAALSSKGIRVLALQGDVRQQEACDRWISETVSKLGGLDILVNCAAGNFLTTAEELTQNGFRTVMEIDATGTFTMSRAAYSALQKSKDPCIINISATLHYGATWWQIHVSAAKSAVDSLTRSLALEWGEAGVRVNGVAPGPIEGTAGLSKLAPVPDAEAKAKALLAESIPLRRLGRKWDIAQACVYLASPAASFISGHTLVVDGAAWMMKPPILPRQVVNKVSRSVEGKSRSIGTADEPRSRL